MTTYPCPYPSRRRTHLLAPVVALALLTGTAAAQVRDAEPSEWTHGTTLSGFIGAGTLSSDVDVVGGLGVGWEITEHFTVEGRGTWFRRGHGATTYSAAVDVLVPLVHRRSLVPFLSAGVGMQRATFRSAVDLPDFYRRRVAATATDRSARAMTFDDVLLTFGGGTDVFVGSHWSLRPAVSVRMVTTRSDRWVVPVYGLHLAYHFETHGALNHADRRR